MDVHNHKCNNQIMHLSVTSKLCKLSSAKPDKLPSLLLLSNFLKGAVTWTSLTHSFHRKNDARNKLSTYV